MDNLALLSLAVKSLMAGGGAYAGLRYMDTLRNASTQPQKDKNELEITLPAARMPKMGGYEEYLYPALVGGLGAAGGFQGASALYEHIKKKQIADKLKEVENNYLTALSQAHQKIGSVNTPHIDKFLTGFITKLAGPLDFLKNFYPEEGFIEGAKRLLPGEVPSAGIGAHMHGGIKNLYDGIAGTTLGKAGLASAIITALIGGGASYHIANNMDKAKNEANRQTTLPTEIKLNVAH
jgi:hypothetical protein